MPWQAGVSATFHFIAVKDQHCLLYNVIRLDASIFCLHLLFSTFAIIHGTLKNFKFSSTRIHFTVSGFFLLILYTIEETRQNIKMLSCFYINAKNPKGKSLGVFISVKITQR